MQIMRTITLEEHFATPQLIEGPGRDMQQLLGVVGRYVLGVDASKLINQLLDIGDSRIDEMNEAGIDVQILSLTRGIENIQDEAEAVKFASSSNDVLAAAIKQHPTRFAGYAILPMLTPQKAADELERTVREHDFKGAMIHGHSRGRYLDDRFFWPVLERAQELGVPLYIHPAAPPESVIKASYAGNYSREVAGLLSISGWGWHIETAIHVLRVILGGAFDVYPNLQLVMGHLGESLPFMMPRLERMFPTEVTKLERTIGSYLRENIHYTFSGFNFTSQFQDLFTQVGVDRIMFSADYPYSSMKEALEFLEGLQISQNEKEQIAHGNAESMLRV